MASINIIRQERRKAFLALKRQMKRVDTAQERTERLIKHVLGRKLNVPEEADLAKVLAQSSEAIKLYREFVGLAEQVNRDFF